MHQSFAVIVLAGLALPALGQSRVLVADRAANAVWIMDDINGNGVIDEPSELWQCFNATNAPATANVDNPNTIAGRGDGLVAVGDQLNQFVLLMRDLNRDGDALDLGESWVAAGPGNAAGVAFAFPTGAAFDAAGVLYVVNAGNAAGADAIYRLVDLTGDGDFQDAGEVQDWVTTGAFGATPNGPFSPQEIAFTGTATQPIGFLRNSSSGLHGVFRFVDLNGNGRADDAGEFTAYWDAANAGGITPSAGFTLEADLAHPGSMYTMQIATGGIDQLIRLTDLNGDDDAQDFGESVIVYSTGEANFSAIDALCLPDGRVLITDNSGKKVYILTDLDHDGRFTSAGERTVYLENPALLVGDLRPLAGIARVCIGNCDGSTTAPALNVNDFTCFLNDFASGSLAANCDSSTSPPILNVNDFACFINAFASGCP